MHENIKGYYVYSTFVFVFGIGLFGFLGYLFYDLIIKLTTTQISNVTLLQSLITLIITVFVGGYFSKSLEYRNSKRLNNIKIQSDIALTIIDLAGLILRNENREHSKQLLINENFKVKIFFDDEVVKVINELCSTDNENELKRIYNIMVDKMKKCIK